MLQQITITIFICTLFSTTVFSGEDVLDGYLLYGAGESTFLVDNNKKVVKQWEHSQGGGSGFSMGMAGYSVYLLPNGNICRPEVPSNSGLSYAAAGGLIQEIDKDGKIVWEFEHIGSDYVMHHDIEPMPNGHVLATVAHKKTSSEAAEKGFTNGAKVTIDYIIEIDPNGNDGPEIVWEWHMWDHLVKAEDKKKYPDRISVDARPVSGGGSYGSSSTIDFSHLNGIGYNPERDQIVVSFRFANEVLVIDHSTTTEEAKTGSGGKSGKGGRILYRWGKPSNYGESGETFFNIIHGATWIPKGFPGEGNIIVLHNNEDSRDNSQVIEIEPPVDANGNYKREGDAFGPNNPIVAFEGDGFFSSRGGNGIKLLNGNVLSSEASGTVRESTPAPERKVVWEYATSDRNRMGGMQNARKYERSYPGIIKLLDLDPKTKVEENRFSKQSAPNHPLYSTVAGGVRFFNVRNRELDIFTVNGKAVHHAVPSGDGAHSVRLGPGLYIARTSGTKSTDATASIFRFSVLP